MGTSYCRSGIWMLDIHRKVDTGYLKMLEMDHQILGTGRHVLSYTITLTCVSKMPSTTKDTWCRL